MEISERVSRRVVLRRRSSIVLDLQQCNPGEHADRNPVAARFVPAEHSGEDEQQVRDREDSNENDSTPQVNSLATL